MNVATACGKWNPFAALVNSSQILFILGCFFSIAFNSVDLAIAFLVPFDVSLMITSGVFIRLRYMMTLKIKATFHWMTKFLFSSIPFALSWLSYISWLKYANEAMTILQWQGVSNISNQCIVQVILTDIQIVSSLLACNFDSQFPCLEKAEDIFNQYNFTEADFDVDFYALTTLYVVFNVFAFIFLWWRVRKY